MTPLAVSGVVTDAAGTGVDDVTVLLLSAQGTAAARTRTCAAGNYRLAPTAPGRYQTVYLRDGFAPATNAVTVERGDHRTDVMLSPAGAVALDPLRQNLIILTTCGASALVMAGIGGVPVAVPFIGSDLRSSQTELQWISDICPLVLSALLLPAGAALDRFGRRRGMVLGMIILTAAMVWSGLAGSADELIISRGIAGLGAALVFPGTLATISAALPPERRSQAVSYWAMSVVVGAGFGFVLVGVLMSFWWWGSIFLTLAALSLVLLVLMLWVVPETRDPDHANFDPVGVVLSAVGLTGVILAVTEGPIHGWLDPLTVGAAATGLLMLAAFVVWELRCARPLIDLGVFRDRAVGAASVTLLVVMTVDYGLFFVFFMYESYVLDYSPLRCALGLVAVCWIGVPLAIAGPMLVRRFGKRAILTSALVLCSAGTATAGLLAHTGTYWGVALGMLLFMGGLSLCMAPPTETILESLPDSQQGVASAINDLVRELGAAFGIAIFGSAFNAGYRDRVAELLDGRDDALADSIRRSPAAGLDSAPDGTAGRSTVDTIHHGFSAGFEVAGFVGAAILLGGAVFVGFRFPSHRRADVTFRSCFKTPDAPAVGSAHSPGRSRPVVLPSLDSVAPDPRRE